MTHSDVSLCSHDALSFKVVISTLGAIINKCKQCQKRVYCLKCTLAKIAFHDYFSSIYCISILLSDSSVGWLFYEYYVVILRALHHFCCSWNKKGSESFGDCVLEQSQWITSPSLTAIQCPFWGSQPAGAKHPLSHGAWKWGLATRVIADIQ